MIPIREQSYGLNVALYNKFTLEDFQEPEQTLLAYEQRIHLPNILSGLSMLKDLTIDMMVEQIKFLNQHETDFGRAVVIADDIWIKFDARLPSLLANQHPRYFNDAAEVQAWLLESSSKQVARHVQYKETRPSEEYFSDDLYDTGRRQKSLTSHHSRTNGNLGLYAQKPVRKEGFLYQLYVLDSRLRGSGGIQ